MKRKILLIALVLTCALFCAFGLVACGEKDDDSKLSGDDHTHELKYFAEHAATCTDDGNIEYWQCESCRKYYSDSDGTNEILNINIDKLGHNAQRHDAKPATCTEKGWHAYVTCSRCEYTTYNEIAVLGHDEQSHSAQAATCTEKGWDAYVACSRCDYTTYNEIAPLGHSASEYAQSGMFHTKRCTVCNEIIEKELHSFNGGVCTICNAYNTDDIYNGTYGYEYFAEMNNSKGLQDLYLTIDSLVSSFHSNGADANDNILATIDFTEYDLSSSEAIAVWNTYRNDKPLYYWISNTVAYDNEKIVIYVVEDYAKGTDRNKQNELMYDKINEFIAPYTDETSAYLIAMAFHDAIIEHIDYVYAESGEPSDEFWAHNICGVFEKKGAVCEGYARAYQLLLNMFGVNNIFVTGDSRDQSHAWNLVQLNDGEWYWYDLTWDDTPNWFLDISYDYCSVTDDDFLSSHTIDSSAATGTDFLYVLPNRAETHYSGNDIKNDEEFTVDSCVYTVRGYNSVMMTKVNKGGKINVPQYVEYKGRRYDVISINGYDKESGNLNFGSVFNSKVTHVSVPVSVKYIGENAFVNMPLLEAIDVDKNNAFYSSSDGVLFDTTYNLLLAYPSAKKASSYTIPEQTLTIGLWSLSNNNVYLKSLTIGKNVELIGATFATYNGAVILGYIIGGVGNVLSKFVGINEYNVDSENPNFVEKDGMLFNSDYTTLFVTVAMENIIIPNSVTNIGGHAFAGCASLKSITIPNSVTSIGQNAFEGCTSLKSITIPNSVTSIDDWMFHGCTGLTSIIIPDGVTNIGYAAFYGCSSLTSITIPDGVTSIEDWAFTGCSGLMSITIPSSVTSVSGSAFNGCEGLTIYCEAASEPSGWDSNWNSRCPVVWNYKNNEVAEDGYIYAFIDGVKYALKNGTAIVCRQLQNIVGNIVIPASVTYKGETYSVTGIGKSAFSNCKDLTSITIPNSVTSIGEIAFYYCSGLTHITIPSSVTSIGKSAFNYCSDLTSITIPSSVTSIGMWAFSGCHGLTIYCKAARLPNGWDREWNDSNCPVVWNCNNNEVAEDGYVYVFIDGVKYALKDGKATVCRQLQNIVGNIIIPASVTYKGETYRVTSIGREAFNNCNGLTSIIIPDGVTCIEGSSFSGCSGLTSITIPSSVTSLEFWAFAGCRGLTTIIIPNSVTSMGDHVFYGCSDLANVTFQGTKAQWTAINKDSDWNDDTGNYTVHCTDGTLSKSES